MGLETMKIAALQVPCLQVGWNNQRARTRVTRVTDVTGVTRVIRAMR